jgi:DNA polymerase-3 subunit alpha
MKPTVFRFNTMNALYRPGPIAYIPSFVKGKMGKRRLFDLEACEELKDTYTVYQEQVMLYPKKLISQRVMPMFT